MHCPKCLTDSREGERFCTHCGTSLAIGCPGCGFSNPPAANFCGGCGKALADSGPIVYTASLPPDETAPERRQLTVLFCDLVDSTTLSTRLDPEDQHGVLRTYQNTCSQLITEYAGYIAQFLGDGIMAYFGYPQAHEDDAERAVLAGLHILASVAGLQFESGLRLRTRVGIATGLVVVGDMIARGKGWEVGVVGETPNLAARIQSLAQPDTVLIGSSTRRLLGNQFDYEDLGLHPLKGFAQAQQLWRVLAERTVDSRFLAVRTSILSELVDRKAEQSLLKERGGKALHGLGQIVLIGGEAGIGKSRLARAMAEWMCEEHGARLIEMQCSSYHTQSALFPVINTLGQIIFAGKRPSDDAMAWQTLRKFLGETDLEPLEETLLLFANLLSIPAPADYPLPPLTPERQRRLSLQHLLDLLVRCGQGKPILLLLEDLHWADPSTLEFVDFIVEQGASLPLLVLLTTRPEFNPRWAFRPHVTVIPLGRLPDGDAITLVRQTMGTQELPPELIESVVTKTDGIPLYLQEYTKTMVESRQSPAGRPQTFAVIPSTLHDLLLARLDRLGEAKQVAQLAALLGREFDGAVLEAVWAGSREALWTGIQRLIEEEVVYPHGESGHRHYVFRHALVQDAAYESLLKSSRAALHRRIAEAVERNFPQIATSEPEWLAQHFSAAHLPLKAIPYWEKAGLRAGSLAAYAEAGKHFETALELVAKLPEDQSRHGLELGLQVHLGMSLSASLGYAATAVESAYQRARELCGLLGDSAELFPVLRGLWSFYHVRSELETARELAEHCVRLGKETQRADWLIEGHTALGFSLAYLGELQEGAQSLNEGIHLYRSFGGDQFSYPTPQDPLLACLSLLALIAWILGDANRAQQCRQEILETLGQRNRPFDLAFAHCYLAQFETLRGRFQEAALHAQEVIAISQRQGYAVWLDAGTLHSAIANSKLGAPEQALAPLTDTLAKWRAGGAELQRSYFLAWLAKSYREIGMTEEALAGVEEAIAHSDSHHERLYAAELHRIRGKLLVCGEEGQVELQTALGIARRQGAKLFELRAAIALYQLGLERGSGEPARAVLKEIAERFAEQGSAAPEELREARALFEPENSSSPFP
ncbi:MAG: adenylate/guanylate cyclase domain-containing protein [Methylococcaceae bacterium]|nr:adenylate/guanylate cyclase domain-containing protein [Methylococcaceae bacterium]